jgi:Tol biopolymer transport system component
MNPNGSGKRNLTPAGWYSADSQDWSPDGRKIAFMGRPSTPPPGIFVMNADGSERRRLTQDGRNPAWSPDGQMIAFNRDDELYVMNADGSGKRRLLRTDGGVLSQTLPFAWSPAQK